MSTGWKSASKFYRYHRILIRTRLFFSPTICAKHKCLPSFFSNINTKRVWGRFLNLRDSVKGLEIRDAASSKFRIKNRRRQNTAWRSITAIHKIFGVKIIHTERQNGLFVPIKSFTQLFASRSRNWHIIYFYFSHKHTHNQFQYKCRAKDIRNFFLECAQTTH